VIGTIGFKSLNIFPNTFGVAPRINEIRSFFKGLNENARSEVK